METGWVRDGLWRTREVGRQWDLQGKILPAMGEEVN